MRSLWLRKSSKKGEKMNNWKEWVSDIIGGICLVGIILGLTVMAGLIAY